MESPSSAWKPTFLEELDIFTGRVVVVGVQAQVWGEGGGGPGTCGPRRGSWPRAGVAAGGPGASTSPGLSTVTGRECTTVLSPVVRKTEGKRVFVLVLRRHIAWEIEELQVKEQLTLWFL